MTRGTHQAGGSSSASEVAFSLVIIRLLERVITRLLLEQERAWSGQTVSKDPVCSLCPSPWKHLCVCMFSPFF